MWNYDNSIVNIANACFKFAGLETYHKVDEDLFNELKQRNCKQLFVLLVDAMGYNNLIQQGFQDSYLLNNLVKVVDTVFPTTTTSATTSFLTGKYPSETNWLSWGMYDEKYKDVIVPFLDKGLFNEVEVEPKRFYQKYPIYNPYVEEEVCDYYYPSWSPYHGVNGFDGLLEAMLEENKTKEHKLVYFYYDQLDSKMHEYGPNHSEINKELAMINTKLEDLTKSLSEDSCVLVIADHGQVEVTGHIIAMDDEVIMNSITRVCLADNALLSVDVKNKDTFLKHMEDHYKDRIMVFSKEEVIEGHLFGGLDARNCDDFASQLGDYLLVPKQNETLQYINLSNKPGSHSSMHKEEKEIPVILLQGRRKDGRRSV